MVIKTIDLWNEMLLAAHVEGINDYYDDLKHEFEGCIQLTSCSGAVIALNVSPFVLVLRVVWVILRVQPLRLSLSLLRFVSPRQSPLKPAWVAILVACRLLSAIGREALGRVLVGPLGVLKVDGEQLAVD